MSTPSSGSRPRTLMSWVFGCIIGVVLGSAAFIVIFYDRPVRRAVDKVMDLAGLRQSMDPDWQSQDARYSHGYDKPPQAEWKGVRSPTADQWNVRPGLDIELVVEGLDYPVNIAFVDEPGPDPDSPVFYVNELHGKVRYLGRDGTLHLYAEGLTNFDPIPVPKSDETGLSGLTIIPGTEDLLITGAFLDESSGLLQNRIMRLYSQPGGKQVDRVEILLELDEYTSPSNQIQQVRFGPDDRLYVSVGDAENHRLSLDLDRFGGKILRMNPDGTACEDNPYYNEFAPEAPRSYVYARGVRNVFDFDFDGEGRLFAVDNGKNIDRFFEVVRGGNYGWDGNPESVRVNALYSWGPTGNLAPVGLEILREGALGEETQQNCYIATYGPPANRGPNAAKSILEVVLDPESGLMLTSPEPIVQYAGEDKATVLGLAEGPDGLYFTDFWGETQSFDDAKGRIYRVFPSEKTLGLPEVVDEQLASLPTEERGRVHFSRNCTTCHRLDGVGGREGPALTNVIANLDARLNSSAYEASLRDLMAKQSTFVEEQRPRIEEVLRSEGNDRIRIWLGHHLEEPRFDHLYAKMPSFADALPDETREDIIAFLMTQR